MTIQRLHWPFDSQNSQVVVLPIHSFFEKFLKFCGDNPNVTIITFAHTNIQGELQQFGIVS